MVGLHDALLTTLAALIGPLRTHSLFNDTNDSSGLHLQPNTKSLTKLRHEERAAVSKTSLAVPNMSGTWIKDKKSSDCMEPVLSLMHVRGIVRQAIKLVKGINIKHTDTTFTVEVFSIIGWFKVVEKYNLNGDAGSFKRRDLRRGRHMGTIRLLPGPPARLLRPLPAAPQKQLPNSADKSEGAEAQAQGRVALDLSWGEPHSGLGTDVYELVEPDLLCVTSTLDVGGQQVINRAVFHRKHAHTH